MCEWFVFTWLDMKNLSQGTYCVIQNTNQGSNDFLMHILISKLHSGSYKASSLKIKHDDCLVGPLRL